MRELVSAVLRLSSSRAVVLPLTPCEFLVMGAWRRHDLHIHVSVAANRTPHAADARKLQQEDPPPLELTCQQN